MAGFMSLERADVTGRGRGAEGLTVDHGGARRRGRRRRAGGEISIRMLLTGTALAVRGSPSRRMYPRALDPVGWCHAAIGRGSRLMCSCGIQWQSDPGSTIPSTPQVSNGGRARRTGSGERRA